MLITIKGLIGKSGKTSDFLSWIQSSEELLPQHIKEYCIETITKSSPIYLAVSEAHQSETKKLKKTKEGSRIAIFPQVPIFKTCLFQLQKSRW